MLHTGKSTPARRLPPEALRACIYGLLVSGLLSASCIPEESSLPEWGTNLVPVEVESPHQVPLGSRFTTSVLVCVEGQHPQSVDVSLAWMTLPSDGEPVATLSQEFQPFRQDFCERVLFEVESDMLGPGIHLPLVTIDGEGAIEEQKERDNFALGDEVRIGTGPDLIVDRVEAPGIVAPGEDLTIGSRVCNLSSDPAGATRARISLAGSEGSEALAVADVPPIPGRGCQTIEVPIDAAVIPEISPFRLELAVDADAVLDELAEWNNAAETSPIAVGTAPNLVIASFDPPAFGYGRFESSAEVCNRGNAPGAVTDVSISYSWWQWSSFDQRSDQCSWGLKPLAPQECQRVQCYAYLPTNDIRSSYPYIDPVTSRITLEVDRGQRIDESREDDNGIGPFFYDGFLPENDASNEATGDPDWQIRSVTAPTVVEEGTAFDIVAELCNDSVLPAPASWVVFYETFDGLDQSVDAYRGFASIRRVWSGDFAPRECRDIPAHIDRTSALRLRDGETVRIGARVEEGDMYRSNNVRLGGKIAVGLAPDYAIESVAGPAIAAPGEDFDIEVRVCNRGNAAGPAGVEVDVLLAGEEGLPAPPLDPGAYRPAVGMVTLPALEPGACHSESVSTAGGAALEPGSYRYAAVLATRPDADPHSDDERVQSGRLVVGNLPDLVIEDLEEIPAGDADDPRVEVRALLCNRGNVAVDEDWMIRVYRTPGSAFLDYEGQREYSFERYTSPEPLDGGACRWLTVYEPWRSLPSAYLDDRAAYLGASVDVCTYFDWCDFIDEADETNNVYEEYAPVP